MASTVSPADADASTATSTGAVESAVASTTSTGQGTVAHQPAHDLVAAWIAGLLPVAAEYDERRVPCSGLQHCRGITQEDLVSDFDLRCDHMGSLRCRRWQTVPLRAVRACPGPRAARRPVFRR